jgi:hypothetical protein
MEITNEQLKDLSVRVVEGFINDKMSLNDGIAKYASEMELNVDQTKRLVETSNTIAYLKLQKEAEDRTFEFPVADYNEVMRTMCVPATRDGSVTEAEFTEQTKTAAREEHKYSPELDLVKAWAFKEAMINRAAITKLAYDKAAVLINIGDVTELLKKDAMALEKLAEVADEETYKRLAALVSKEPTRELQTYIFKEAELNDAQRLVDLYKAAHLLVKESQHREELEKRAASAGAYAAKAVGGLAYGAAAPVGAAAAGVGTLASKGIKRIGKSKLLHPVDIAAAALTEPKASSNIWDNLHGSQKRF